EQKVFRQHLGSGEAVEQRGLARVGVADQRHDRMRHALARFALEIAPAHDGFELDLDLGDAVVDEAAVDFDLRFAGAADEAEAAALALEMGPAPHQAAALIREMRELDLETALARARAGAEDLEDQRRAVDDLAAPRLLEV